MSEDHLVNRHVCFDYISFGDPNAQPPPTPKQTPNPLTFPSPIFETPKPPQGSFAEASGQTPRYAEDYSVFNATPGNLRGTQGPFADFIPTDLIASSLGSSLGHKRLLSAETIAIEIASRGSLTSPHHRGVRLPPVEPSRRLPSSPAAFVFPRAGPSAEAELQLSPNLPPHPKSSKKLRRGTLTLPSSEATQVLSPPPSAHKGGKKLAPRVNMQDDQQYGQQEFENQHPAHDMAVLMSHAGDMFGYAMPAPGAAAHGAFWDPSSMSMDIDFAAAQTNFFQPSHRHTGSFDWNSEVQLFQDPVPAPPPAPTPQENAQPVRRERALAPKPPAAAQTTAPAAANSGMPAAYPGSADGPFGLTSPIPMEGVDPGLLYSRPPTSSMDAEFSANANTGSANAVPDNRKARAAGVPRRANTTKETTTKKGKMPDRSFTNSSANVANRPGLERSLSENRGKKMAGRTLPSLPPASRPTPTQAGEPSPEAGTAGARPSGRVSPVKTQQRRLSSLASIPESMSNPNLARAPRTSVRFTIDAHGRARAETTFLLAEAGGPPGMTRSNTSRELSARSSWNSSDDESSTDEEPIIIPSRSSSLNTSFALPDPRRPVGSIFHHSARSSLSDRSTSNSNSNNTVAGDGSSGAFPPLPPPPPPPAAARLGANEDESEGETVLADDEKGGDAASELRKVVQDRQKRSQQMDMARSTQRTTTTTTTTTKTTKKKKKHAGLAGSTISPVSLTDSTYGMDGQAVRCVCNGSNGDEQSDGFMLQCESCEMWLHGGCVNITMRTMPSVYICGFCAGMGVARDMNDERASLTDKLFRAFR